AEAGGVTSGPCRFVGVRSLLFVPLPVPFPAAPPGAFLGCAPFARVSSSRRSRVLAVGRSAGGAAIRRGGSAVCRVPRRGGRALVRECARGGVAGGVRGGRRPVGRLLPRRVRACGGSHTGRRCTAGGCGPQHACLTACAGSHWARSRCLRRIRRTGRGAGR